MPVWVQIDAYDPVAGAAVTLRAGNMDDASVCMTAGGPWWPMIAKAPVLRYDLFDGAFGGEISAPTTAFTLQVEAWPSFGRYALADARVQIWTDIAAAPIFDGRVTAQPKLAGGQAEISIKVDDGWLDKPLLDTYAGTTGLEGPAGLKGQAKPLALGAPRYVSGKLIDSVNNVFQVSAYGAVQGFEAALERLARFGTPLANYATYADLVAASIPAGAWATCNAQGLARFGAPTTGQISFLIWGDSAGPDGWARKPGQLIRRLALSSGGAGKIHDASLNALDAARPYNLSIYLDQQTTARQLIQGIAASVNAVAGVSWTGKLFVVPVGLGAATMTLAADGSALPPVRSVEQMEVAAPFANIAIEAERAWTVHQLADIAFVDPLVDMGVYNNGSYYRPGNIVQWAGATWRYKTGVTAGSGNPPPTPPTASNAWWTVLAQQGAAGTKGADAINNVNRVKNTLFEQGVTGWRVPYLDRIAVDSGFPTTFVAYGVPILKLQGTATASGSVFSIGTDNTNAAYFISVTADERLAVQVAVESSGTAVTAYVYWRAADGSTVASDLLGASSVNTPFGTRLAKIVTVPSGAITCSIEVYFTAPASGSVFGAIMKVMVSSATATQTEFPPFTAGPADGGQGGKGDKGDVGGQGNPGSPGAPAVYPKVTRKAVGVEAYSNGVVKSFANANGLLTVMSGSADVTAGAFLSATASGCSGTINTSYGNPVAGQPKGYYQVTDMSADAATLTLTANYNGQELTEVFSVSKLLGGYERVGDLPTDNLFDGRIVYLLTDKKIYRWNGSIWDKSADGADITPRSVTTNAIAAGAVTAAEMYVTELSAITARIGLLRTSTVGQRTELDDNGMRVYNASNVLVYQNGIY